jgi:hypothetical protein
MKKQFNVKLADGTNSVIGCNEEQLPDILKYHFSGEQLETAVVTELPQTIEIKKKTITYKTLDSFTSEVDNEPIFNILNFKDSRFTNYKGWEFESTEEGILATPADIWTDRTPVFITTVDELIILTNIIEGVHA